MKLQTMQQLNALDNNELSFYQARVDNGLYMSAPHQQQQHARSLEDLILTTVEPLEINSTDEIVVDGHCGIWVNQTETERWRQSSLTSMPPLEAYPINQDAEPELITKPTRQKIVYEQEIAIRYLRPPTPPASGEILIRQEPSHVTPPPPPLIIRQQPPRPITPQPLVIRERPPPPPPVLCPKLITISGKRLPPPPRKVIIERLPLVPSKPQSVLIERWLPYRQARRRVIFQRCNQIEPVQVKPKNVIVQWNAPKVVIKKEIQNLGVVRADPEKYSNLYCASLTPSDRLPDFVRDMAPPPGLTLAADQPPANNTPELYGDLEALNLIDLDREGLSMYKSILRRKGVGSHRSPPPLELNYDDGGRRNRPRLDLSHIPRSELCFLSHFFRNEACQITVDEVKRTFRELNNVFGKSYNEQDAFEFFKTLDENSDGLVDFEDFKRVFSSLF